MRNLARLLPTLTLTLFALTLGAQSPIDIGLHLTPKFRYLNSSPSAGEPRSDITSGLSGLSAGGCGGVFMEFELTPYWFLRAGVDFSYNRNTYDTERSFPDTGLIRAGQNRIDYTSIDIPVAVIYRFDYLKNGGSFLAGIGVTVDRLIGSPNVESSFASGPSLDDNVELASNIVTIFAGYEHYLSNRLVLGVEPYVAYVPSSFKFESLTTTEVRAEVGVALRLRLDN